jgi:hypothetical protein
MKTETTVINIFTIYQVFRQNDEFFGCRMLTVYCRVSISVVNLGSWLSGVGC